MTNRMKVVDLREMAQSLGIESVSLSKHHSSWRIELMKVITRRRKSTLVTMNNTEVTL